MNPLINLSTVSTYNVGSIFYSCSKQPTEKAILEKNQGNLNIVWNDIKGIPFIYVVITCYESFSNIIAQTFSPHGPDPLPGSSPNYQEAWAADQNSLLCIATHTSQGLTLGSIFTYSIYSVYSRVLLEHGTEEK